MLVSIYVLILAVSIEGSDGVSKSRKGALGSEKFYVVSSGKRQLTYSTTTREKESAGVGCRERNTNNHENCPQLGTKIAHNFAPRMTKTRTRDCIFSPEPLSNMFYR